MRTTLTLDADVARAMRLAVRERKASFKVVVNEALRQGLGLKTARKKSPRFVVNPHHGGFLPGLDPYTLNELAAELEDQASLFRDKARPT